MKNPKNYLLLAVIVLAGYAVGIAYAEDNDGMEDQAEYQQLKTAKISITEAIEIAQAAHPNMLVSEVDFEEEYEVFAYSMELIGENSETEITINAETGKIILEKD